VPHISNPLRWVAQIDIKKLLLRRKSQNKRAQEQALHRTTLPPRLAIPKDIPVIRIEGIDETKE
jgi:hypothetical protein